MEVGIREFRNNLAAILDEVDKGTVVTITHHGRARATLQPVEAHVESPVERGIREGWLTPGPAFHRQRSDRRPTGFLDEVAGKQAWANLMEDRADDR